MFLMLSGLITPLALEKLLLILFQVSLTATRLVFLKPCRLVNSNFGLNNCLPN